MALIQYPQLTWTIASRSVAGTYQEITESFTDGAGSSGSGLMIPPIGWRIGSASAATNTLVASFQTNVYKSNAGFYSGSGTQTSSLDVTGGNCLRTTSAYQGSFSPGTWSIYLSTNVDDNTGVPSYAPLYRLWKGKHPSGSDAIEFTPLCASGAVFANGSGGATGSPVASTASIAIPTFIQFDAEYLFVQTGLRIESNGQNNALIGVMLRSGSQGTKVISSNFSPAGGQFWP